MTSASVSVIMPVFDGAAFVAEAIDDVLAQTHPPFEVIVVPGYFLRYIPLLGPDLAWLYVGFRQAAYEAGVSRRAEKKFNAPSKKVARYAGVSLRAFWRWVARPDTWNLLRGLVTLVDSPVHGDGAKMGVPTSPRTYRWP
jgi:hypothetical protein